MSKHMKKKIINFVLVVAYSFVHYYYLAPIIYELTRSALANVGVWSIVVGLWGTLVRLTIVQTIFFTENYRKENFYLVSTGVVMVIIGVVLQF